MHLRSIGFSQTTLSHFQYLLYHDKKAANLLPLLHLLLGNTYAQKLVGARVVDYITNIDIAADSLLKVELLAADSSFIAEGWASRMGNEPKYKTYAEAVVEREGSYIIRVSHPDYYTLYAPIQIKFYRRESEIFLGKLALKRKLRKNNKVR